MCLSNLLRHYQSESLLEDIELEDKTAHAASRAYPLGPVRQALLLGQADYIHRTNAASDSISLDEQQSLASRVLSSANTPVYSLNLKALLLRSACDRSDDAARGQRAMFQLEEAVHAVSRQLEYGSSPPRVLAARLQVSVAFFFRLKFSHPRANQSHTNEIYVSKCVVLIYMISL